MRNINTEAAFGKRAISAIAHFIFVLRLMKDKDLNTKIVVIVSDRIVSQRTKINVNVYNMSYAVCVRRMPWTYYSWIP